MSKPSSLKRGAFLSVIGFLAYLSVSPANAIVGADREVKIGEASYVVSIQDYSPELSGDGYSTTCSGSLISPTIVITAAHCISENQAVASWRVLAGSKNLEDPNIQKIKVIEAVYHKKYDQVQDYSLVDSNGTVLSHHEAILSSGDSKESYDIALLLLATPVVNVSPVSLAYGGYEPTLSSWRAYGFGVGDNGLLSNTLLTAEQYDYTQAAKATLGDPLIRNYAVGAFTSTEEASGACFGDSGGPLVDGKNVLIGLTSFGISNDCNTQDWTIYTKVSSYSGWISTAMRVLEYTQEQVSLDSNLGEDINNLKHYKGATLAPGYPDYQTYRAIPVYLV